jgi:hypothetical protein
MDKDEQKQEALEAVRHQLGVIRDLTEDLPIFVTKARMSGATWTQIGNALGVSKQAAQQRYAVYLPYEFPLTNE